MPPQRLTAETIALAVSRERLTNGISGFLFLILSCLSIEAQTSSDLESSARRILEKPCWSCHSTELRMSREDAVKGGKSGPAIIPNQLDQSLMVRKIFGGQMPPGDPLPSQEREAIRNWIAAGAPWRDREGKAMPQRRRAGLDWWSFQPLRNDPLPDSKDLPAEWSVSPIDRFIIPGSLKKTSRLPRPRTVEFASDEQRLIFSGFHQLLRR
jgi:hypothetical protein